MEQRIFYYSILQNSAFEQKIYFVPFLIIGAQVNARICCILLLMLERIFRSKELFYTAELGNSLLISVHLQKYRRKAITEIQIIHEVEMQPTFYINRWPEVLSHSKESVVFVKTRNIYRMDCVPEIQLYRLLLHLTGYTGTQIIESEWFFLIQLL